MGLLAFLCCSKVCLFLGLIRSDKFLPRFFISLAVTATVKSPLRYMMARSKHI